MEQATTLIDDRRQLRIPEALALAAGIGKAAVADDRTNQSKGAMGQFRADSILRFAALLDLDQGIDQLGSFEERQTVALLWREGLELNEIVRDGRQKSLVFVSQGWAGPPTLHRPCPRSC